MAALTVQTLSDAGTTVTHALPGASDTANIGSGHNTFLVYKNTSATVLTVTVAVPGNTFFGVAEQDNVVTVPITTGEKWIPLRKEYDDGTGNATITTSAQVAGMTVAVVRLS